MKTTSSKVKLAFLLTLIVAVICCVSVAFAGIFGAKNSAAFADEVPETEEGQADNDADGSGASDNATFTYNGRTYTYNTSYYLDGTSASAQLTKWKSIVNASSSSYVVLATMEEDWVATYSASYNRSSFGANYNTTSSGYLDSYGGLLIPSGKNIILDLNGHSLDRRLTSGDINNYAGPVITVEGTGVLTIIDTSLVSTGTITGGCNYAANYGGGIRVAGNGTLNFDGGTLAGNYAAYDGGGVYLAGSTSKFVMNGGTIAGNYAQNAGGGVYGLGTITINGGTISSNKLSAPASSTASVLGGGGVYAGGTFTMTGGNITNNTSVHKSGGVQAVGTVNISGGSITGNTGAYGAGLCSAGNITMSGGTISNNVASSSGTASGNGGGIFTSSNSASVRISGGSISNNSGTTGGGVCGNGTVTVTGGSISGNRATSNGGGIYSASTFTMSGGSVSGNTATNYGGGIYSGSSATNNISGGSISGNSASYGGGVYSTSTFTLSGTASISGNTASSAGGGVRANTTANINGGSITENKCTSTSTSNGGGGIACASTFTMTAGDISRNTSSTYGGGVLGSNTVTISGGSISGNTGTQGGGVYATGAVTISGTTSVDGNSATSNGGGIHGESTVTIQGGSVNGNKLSGNYGGGVYSKGAFKISGNSTISGNTVQDYGAGVAAFNSFVMNGSVISDNTATVWNSYGGGVYTSGSYSCSVSGVISGNRSGAGAGIYISNGSLDVWSAQFIDNGAAGYSGNSVSGNGGAIYFSGSSLEVENSTFYDNSGDLNGGAIYVNDYTSLSIKNSEFNANNAYSDGGKGGAVYLVDKTTAALTISGCTFTKQYASSNEGGALYIYSTQQPANASATITVKDCYFQENDANESYGGGVYIYSGYKSVNLTNCQFLDNTAYEEGDSVFIDGVSSTRAHTLTISDCYFKSSYLDTNVVLENWASVIVNNITVTNSRAGIRFRACVNVTMRECLLTKIKDVAAVYFIAATSAYRLTMTDCIVYEDYYGGVEVNGTTTNNVYLDGGSYTAYGDTYAVNTNGELHVSGAIQLNASRVLTTPYSASILNCGQLYDQGEDDYHTSYASITTSDSGIITKGYWNYNSVLPSTIFHSLGDEDVWLLNGEAYIGYDQPTLTWQRSTSNSWSSYTTLSAGATSTTAAYTGSAWLARAYYSTTSNGYKTSVTYYKDGVGSAIAQSNVKNVGTYVARINDPTSEWANPELTIIITKKAITAISGGTVNSKVYDGTTRATVDLSGVTFTGKVTADTLTLSYSSATYADANAGTGKTVTVTGLVLGGASAANYTLNPTSHTISTGAITAYKTSVIWSDTTLGYNGSAQGPTAKYKDINGTEQALTLSGKVTATNVGSYTSTVTKPTNYDFTNTSCTWNIIKADPKVTPVFTNDTNLVVGMDMPTVELTTGDTAGTISWLTNELTIGTNNYTWVFVPTDSNYNAVTGTKSLTVAAADGTTVIGIEVVFEQSTTLTTASNLDNIDLYGTLTVEEVYSDKSKTALTSDKYTLSAPEGGLKAGSNVITVTYTIGEDADARTFTKTFKVFVEQSAGESTLIGVSASFAQSGAILTTTELKDLTKFGKLIVEEVYSDGKKVAVTKNYKLSIGTDDKFTAGVNTVKVTYTVGEGEDAKDYETTFTVFAQATAKTVVVVVINNLTSIVGENLVDKFGYTVLTGGVTFEEGELEFKTDADKFAVGTYKITGKYVGESEEYEIKFVDGTYTVTANPDAKQVTVVISNATSVYDSAIATNFGYTVIGLEEGETLTGITLTKEEGTDAGEYAITGRYEGSNKYNVEFIDGIYTITPKMVTVVIDNKTTLEGKPIANLTYNVIGLEEGEELDGNIELNTKADSQTPNEYAITGTYDGNNYAITWVEGKYTVVTGVAAGTIIVIVDNKTSQYGNALEELTFTVVDDTVTAEDLKDDIELVLDEAAATGDAGKYAITGTYKGTDRTVKVINGTYTITPQIVKVLIDSKTSFKGAELVPLTSNAAADIAADITLTTKATGLTAGEFEITGTYDGNKNYDVQFINGVYTVKEVNSDVTLVVVVIDNQTSVVGSDTKKLTYTTVGLEEGETLTGVELTSNVDKNKVGAYAITGKYTGSGNYVVVFVDGVYTVTAEAVAEVKISAKQTGEIFANSTLDDVKSRLVFTLSVDGKESALTTDDYTLTMNLADGTVDVTVTVDGEMHTETLSIFVTAKQMIGISAEYTQGTDRITPNTSKSDIPVRVTASYNDGTETQIEKGNYILNGTLTVGTTTLVVTYSDGSKTFTASFDVTVSPLEEGEVTEITVDWANLSFIYDGREHSPIATFVAGTYNVVLEIEIDGENITDGKAIKTGNYVAKVTQAAIDAALADGYKLVENVYMDFAIEEAELKIEWSNGTTVEFDGDEHNPVYNISANIDDGKIGYKFVIVPKAGSKLTADGKAVNAGTYIAKVVLMDSDNYKVNGDLEFEFSIGKSHISKKANAENKEFENLAEAIDYVKGLYGDRKVTVTGTQNADGKYEVTVKLEDETNYEWTEGGTAAQSFKFASIVAPEPQPEPDGISNILIIALIVAMVVVAFIALIAFIVALKKRKTSEEDNGGFYESVNA